MIICSCAVVQCSDEPGRCDIQRFINELQAQRQTEGKAPLGHAPQDIKHALTAFYRRTHGALGIRPCHSCAGKIRAEIATILGGGLCRSAPPQVQAACGTDACAACTGEGACARLAAPVPEVTARPF
jgi:hypothetical protein